MTTSELRKQCAVENYLREHKDWIAEKPEVVIISSIDEYSSIRHHNTVIVCKGFQVPDYIWLHNFNVQSEFRNRAHPLVAPESFISTDQFGIQSGFEIQISSKDSDILLDHYFWDQLYVLQQVCQIRPHVPIEFKVQNVYFLPIDEWYWTNQEKLKVTIEKNGHSIPVQVFQALYPNPINFESAGSGKTRHQF